jgi:hypothetical protein
MADIRITPASSVMSFTSSLNYVENLTQNASGSLNLYGSGSTGRTELLSIDGNNGRLFTVSDDLSDSLFSVNTVAGLPVIEAFADNTVVMGQYGQNVLVVTGSMVGIGTNTPEQALHIATGSLLFTSQSTNTISVRLSPGGGSSNIDNYLDLFAGGSRRVRMGNNPFDATGYGTGLQVTGRVVLRASALGSAATHILVFDGDPDTTNRGIYTRTPAQLRSDMGAGTVTSIATNNGVTGGTITSTGTIGLATAYGDTVNPYASKTANTFLAAPNGSSGTPSFRAIAAADVPTLNQNTTGTATNATNATVTTSAADSAFKIPFANTTGASTGNYGLLQDSESGIFTYNPSSNRLIVPNISGSTINLNGGHSLYNYLGVCVLQAASGTTIQLGGGPGGVQNNVNVANGTLAVNQTSPQGRLHVYQPTNLGGTASNSLILQTLHNTGGSGGNNVYIKDYALRDATGTDWTTWRHHNSIDIDGSHNTPGTNTKAFYERDPLSGLHEFGQEATYAVTIDGVNRRLGVATRTPIRELQVGDFTGNREICIGTSTTGFGSVVFGDGASGNDPWRGYLSYNHSGDYMVIGTTNAERVRVTAAGAMGLGVTPTNTSGRFEASNDIVAYSSSDKRWKTNIKNIDSPLEKISQINGVEFDWIEDEPVHGNKGHDIGVIAQEIESIIPEAVQTRESGMKAVKYEKIIPLLIEVVKEQQKQIEELKQIVNGITK